MPHHHGEPPPLLLDRQLRTTARDEVRSWSEEDERSVRLFYERSRRLHEVMAEGRHRGASVRAILPHTVLSGRLALAAADCLTLLSDDTETHIRLEAVTALGIEPAVPPQTNYELSGPATFAARLRQLEMAGVPVTLIPLTARHEFTGRIRAVARDHLILQCSDRQWLIPDGQLAAVQAACAVATPRSVGRDRD